MPLAPALKFTPAFSCRQSQRDRSLIRSLLTEIDRYCARNLQERENRAEAERMREHEAQHTQLVGSHNELFTAGDSPGKEGRGDGGTTGRAEEEEEEKEVDPSLIGSLDDVYTDEPGSISEDPFKRVPVMDPEHETASLKQMEKKMDALAVYSEEDSLTLAEGECDDQCSSLDIGVRRPSPSVDPSPVRVPSGSRQGNEVNNSETGQFSRAGTERHGGAGEELLPDIVDSAAALTHDPEQRGLVGHRGEPGRGESSAGSPPDIQVSSRGPSGAPDVASRHDGNSTPSSQGRLPLDIAVGAQQSVDLLDHTAGGRRRGAEGSSRPVDLTDGLITNVSSAHNS